jgi:hypothetical protein
MLVICGNTPAYNHAREPHQGIRFHADASQGDIYRPFCKRVWRVDDAKFLKDVMPRALNLAQTGRSGAVNGPAPQGAGLGLRVGIQCQQHFTAVAVGIIYALSYRHVVKIEARKIARIGGIAEA